MKPVTAGGELADELRARASDAASFRFSAAEFMILSFGAHDEPAPHPRITSNKIELARLFFIRRIGVSVCIGRIILGIQDLLLFVGLGFLDGFTRRLAFDVSNP